MDQQSFTIKSLPTQRASDVAQKGDERRLRALLGTMVTKDLLLHRRCFFHRVSKEAVPREIMFGTLTAAAEEG